MKRLYMLLLAALVLISLCACQTTEEVPADTAAPTAAPVEAPVEEAPQVRTAQVVETGSGVTVLSAKDWAQEYP